jgi:hypothetical protein
MGPHVGVHLVREKSRMTATQPASAWTFVGAVGSSEPFAIEGLDVWQHQWHSVAGAPRAAVRDPHHNQPFEMSVYRIVDGSRSVVFAAGEFSNGIFGFYVPTARVGAPPMPIASHLVPDRPWMERFGPYVPLAASIVELPWIVLTVMMFMGTRENSTGPNPYWQRQFSAMIILPAAIGLVVGLIVLFRGGAAGTLARVALAIGCLACAGFVYGFGLGMFAPVG